MIKLYNSKANARRALAQYKRHNKQASLFLHNCNKQDYKLQKHNAIVAYAIYLK